MNKKFNFDLRSFIVYALEIEEETEENIVRFFKAVGWFCIGLISLFSVYDLVGDLLFLKVLIDHGDPFLITLSVLILHLSSRNIVVWFFTARVMLRHQKDEEAAIDGRLLWESASDSESNESLQSIWKTTENFPVITPTYTAQTEVEVVLENVASKPKMPSLTYQNALLSYVPGFLGYFGPFSKFSTRELIFLELLLLLSFPGYSLVVIGETAHGMYERIFHHKKSPNVASLQFLEIWESLPQLILSCVVFIEYIPAENDTARAIFFLSSSGSLMGILRATYVYYNSMIMLEHPFYTQADDLKNITEEDLFNVAITGENVNYIQNFVNQQKDINVRLKPGDYGETAMFWAIRKEHSHVVQKLLRCKADVNIKNKGKSTPKQLLTRIVEDKIKNDTLQLRWEGLVKIIISFGMINTTEFRGRTILEWAVEKGIEDCIDLLILANVDTNKQHKERSPVIIQAVETGNFSLLHQLVQAKADLNLRSSTRGFALPLWIQKHADASGVEFLLAMKADVGQTDEKGNTGLHWALENNHTEIILLLLTSKSASHSTFPLTELKKATTWSSKFISGRQQKVAIKKLLQLDSASADDLLHQCIHNDDFELMEKLLDWGGNFLARSPQNGYSLELEAARQGKMGFFKMKFVKSFIPALIHKREKEYSLLLAAKQGGHSEIYRLFVEHSLQVVYKLHKRPLQFLVRPNDLGDTVISCSIIQELRREKDGFWLMDRELRAEHSYNPGMQIVAVDGWSTADKLFSEVAERLRRAEMPFTLTLLNFHQSSCFSTEREAFHLPEYLYISGREGAHSHINGMYKKIIVDRGETVRYEFFEEKVEGRKSVLEWDENWYLVDEGLNSDKLFAYLDGNVHGPHVSNRWTFLEGEKEVDDWNMKMEECSWFGVFVESQRNRISEADFIYAVGKWLVDEIRFGGRFDDISIEIDEFGHRWYSSKTIARMEDREARKLWNSAGRTVSHIANSLVQYLFAARKAIAQRKLNAADTIIAYYRSWRVRKSLKRNLLAKDAYPSLDENEKSGEDAGFVPNDEDTIGSPDLMELEHIELENILNTLKHRFMEGLMYTTMGKVLIAIKSDPELHQYAGNLNEAEDLKTMVGVEPHPYATADSVYGDLMESFEGSGSAIVVYGERGSGITSAVRAVEDFLCVKSKRNDIRKIMEHADTVRWAFGNAYSNNQDQALFSRVVTFTYNKDRGGIKLWMVRNKTILLGASRVVIQNRKEQNFNAFYCALAAEKFEYEKFSTVTSGRNFWEQKVFVSHLPKSFWNAMKDKQEFVSILPRSYWNAMKDKQYVELAATTLWPRLCKSLKVFKINAEEVQQILMAVLFLGQIFFHNDDQDFATIREGSNEVLAHTAKLLQIPDEDLESMLCSNEMRIGKKVIIKKIKCKDALVHRDSVALSLYSRLFVWINQRVEEKLETVDYSEDSSHSSIGQPSCIKVWQVAGFSSNGNALATLEQLCENYANEKAHALFLTDVILKKKKLYDQEGLKWELDEIDRMNRRLNFMEHTRQGVFPVLWKLSMTPNPDVATFYQILKQVSGNNGTNKKKKKKRNTIKTYKCAFKHYAGPVTYNLKEFFTRNVQKLSKYAEKVLRGTNLWLLTEILGKRKRHKRKTYTTFASSFTKWLEDATKVLQDGCEEYYFIRCIKPNSSGHPKHFCQRFVASQIKGIPEALHLLKNAYTTKVSYEQLCRMSMDKIQDATWSFPRNRSEDALLGLAAAVLEAFEVPRDTYEFGTSGVFFRFGGLSDAESKFERGPTSEQMKSIMGYYKRYEEKKLKTKRNMLLTVKQMQMLDRQKLSNESAEQNI